MRTITIHRAKQIDLKAIQELGLSTLIMMENAGIRITDFVLLLLRRKTNKKVAVFCGKGNNAGDGLVVSRQLLCEGIDVHTYLLAPRRSLSFAAAKNLAVLSKLTKKIWRIKTERDLQKVNLARYGLLIDAIFGIGLRGEVGGIFKLAIQRINSSRITVVSVDVPSGLNADNGRIQGEAVKAKYTLSLIAPKRGFLFRQGQKFVGRVIVRHIGFPP